MKKRITLVIEKQGKWYLAYVCEITDVNTPGRTRGRNLKEALKLILKADKELAEGRRF